MSYDWKKPWLIMNPEVMDKIDDFDFQEEIRTFTNVVVTSKMPLKDEVWLVPANEIQRLASLTMNGLKYKISQFNKNSEE